VNTTAPAAVVLDKLRAALAFEAMGEPAGNLTVGRGRFEGRAVRVAIVENRAASGALGAVECERLAALLRIVARERAPLVLFLDSAGAKVSEGLKALGAFRALFHAGLEAAMSGAPIAAVLGKNCYGGSSMLAHLASHRLFSPGTQLAMSGPAILASGAGMNVLDEMFRAVAEASISAASRAKASPANVPWRSDLPMAEWIRVAIAEAKPAPRTWLERHQALGMRLPEAARQEPAWEALRRRDIEYLYPDGYDVREQGGFIAGEGRRGDGSEPLLGLVGKAPVGAERAWLFASAAWKLAASSAPPKRVRVLLDSATHAARLDDEKIVLSEFIVDMSAALAVLAARGARIELTILGAAGGGVYVALAAPAHVVNTVHGATIQVLPGAAIAAILGEENEKAPDAGEYVAAGVADGELRIGLPPKVGS
jgi:acetyl-CoA carboxylase beta subunit